MSHLKTIQIGELAKRVGVSSRSLRYYEQQGLLAPSRDTNGYRLYDPASIVRAENIKHLFEVGLTSSDILHYIENDCLDRPLVESPHCAGELDTAQKRLSELDERITRLQSLRERLAAHHTAVSQTIEQDDPPPR